MRLLHAVRCGTLLVGFGVVSVTGCSGGSNDDDAAGSGDESTEEVAESSTTTAEPATTTTAASALPAMTGFCADLPVAEVVALFEEAAIEETVADAQPELCAMELKSAAGETVAAFSIGVITDVAPGGFEESQDELFAANRLVEEETNTGSRPFREAFLLGEQAEIITGAVSQLSILDGDHIWYVQQSEGDEPFSIDQFVAVGQLVLDNPPAL